MQIGEFDLNIQVVDKPDIEILGFNYDQQVVSGQKCTVNISVRNNTSTSKTVKVTGFDSNGNETDKTSVVIAGNTSRNIILEVDSNTVKVTVDVE